MSEYSSSEKKVLENAIEKDAREKAAQQEREEMEQSNRNGTEEQEQKNIEMGGGEKVRLSSYAGPLIVACFKDIMDLSLITSVPGIGTLLTICINVFIAFLLIFPKKKYLIVANGKLLIIDAFILMGLVPIEGIAFPFNLLPFTVGAIGMIYMYDKKFVTARNEGNLKSKKKELTGVIRKALKQ